jgi:hypothetical protein
MFFCCEWSVLSGRGLCDELIIRPEEFYRLWCVVVCKLENIRMRSSWPALGHTELFWRHIFLRNVVCNSIAFSYGHWKARNIYSFALSLCYIPQQKNAHFSKIHWLTVCTISDTYINWHQCLFYLTSSCFRRALITDCKKLHDKVLSKEVPLLPNLLKSVPTFNI